MNSVLRLDEADRQLVLIALAHLSIERPGWDNALNRIAVEIDQASEGRAVLYDKFRALAAVAVVHRAIVDTDQVAGLR
jgi:hypothetical protein